jgi:nucleoside 2-deoxyribosyltransferase
MKITICGSIAFYKEIIKAKKKLEAMGHEVKTPPAEISDDQGKIIDVETYYVIRKEGINNPNSWLWNKKEELIKNHFKKIEWCDAILVTNYDKNGVKGYVGGNTLMEMGLALHLGKPIFMINEIPELNYKEEILGMKPVIIKNLEEIK